MVTASSEKPRDKAKDIEREALVLFAGRPSVLEAFYELTDKKILKSRWNPMDDPSEWESEGKLGDGDIRFMAAVMTLLEKGYIAGVTDEGPSNYIVTASEMAETVRSVLDRLPDTLKGKVREEVERSKV